MPYYSEFYGIEVRDSIAKEWTNIRGEVDDMMAGLHEIRARMAESDPEWREIHEKLQAHSDNQEAA